MLSAASRQGWRVLQAQGRRSFANTVFCSSLNRLMTENTLPIFIPIPSVGLRMQRYVRGMNNPISQLRQYRGDPGRCDSSASKT